ncbi:MAG: putative nucleic acid-binding Zn ribbon protein [Enterobacterales bacterium]|jgi:predicted nucleic acid-binding Zn ribbon protein
MSYVLRRKIADEDYEFFREWVKKTSKSPLYSEKFRYARHWKDKTNCERFLSRNKGALKNVEPFRVIADRHCEYCGTELEKERRTTSTYCTDDCRKKAFKEASF